jgi:hypothetical protein
VNPKNDFVDRLNYNPYPKITTTHFNLVSPIINSKTLLRLREMLCGLYFWIHFHIDMWLLLTNLQDNAFAVFLNDKPRKYRYNP